MTTAQSTSERHAALIWRGRLGRDLLPWINPVAALSISSTLAPWQAMGLIAFSIFMTCKWLTWRDQRFAPGGAWRTFAYFVAWPGLDADRFLNRDGLVERPCVRELIVSILLMLCGTIVVWMIVPTLSDDQLWWKGAFGFAGMLMVLHFGSFGILAWCWQRAGVDAPALMDRPFLTTSLADFWGRRWNRAYRRVSHDLFYTPLSSRYGATVGLIGAFLASGLIHELAISVPARTGYGGPTAYFLIQGVGMWWEHTPTMRQTIRRKSALGRIVAAMFIFAPAPLLFHEAFLTRVIVPFLQAIGA